MIFNENKIKKRVPPVLIFLLNLYGRSSGNFIGKKNNCKLSRYIVIYRESMHAYI